MEAEYRAKASALTDDEIKNALPYLNERKRAVYEDVLARRNEAKADDMRQREVAAGEKQAEVSVKALYWSKWAIAISVLALIVTVVEAFRG